MPAEQRRWRRKPMGAQGFLYAPDGQRIGPCEVRDVSDGGAMIHVRSSDLPDVFVLHFNESGKQRHCRVVWRQGGEVGVAFTDRGQVNFGRRIANR